MAERYAVKFCVCFLTNEKFKKVQEVGSSYLRVDEIHYMVCLFVKSDVRTSSIVQSNRKAI